MNAIIKNTSVSPIDSAPEVNWNELRRIPIQENDEPMVPLSRVQSAMTVSCMYAHMQLPGAINECFVREGVFLRLQRVAQALAPQYTMVILDGWRPHHIQSHLFNLLENHFRHAHPELTDEQLKVRTEEFVAPPSLDTNAPSPHSTGGSVDITLMGADGRCLDMGTLVDEPTMCSHTAYFESSKENDSVSHQARDNRRRLYCTMREHEFTNLPSEWWHYDYGNQLWANYTGKEHALYGATEPEISEAPALPQGEHDESYRHLDAVFTAYASRR